MIELNKIEAKIDAILDSETNVSLTNWLMNKRSKELNHLLGKGSFVSFSNHSFTFCSTNQSTIVGEPDEIAEGSDTILFAA